MTKINRPLSQSVLTAGEHRRRFGSGVPKMMAKADGIDPTFIMTQPMRSLRSVSYLILLAALTLFAGSLAQAQDTLTGAFEGNVTNSQTGAPLKGAGVEIINQQTGVVIKLQT